MVFERFAGEAKRVIVVAEREAVALGHDFIGTEHILLGLLGVAGTTARQALADRGVTPALVRDSTERAARASGYRPTTERDTVDALASIGIDLDQVRRKMADAFGPDRFRYPRAGFTRRAKRVLELSAGEASGEVGPEHLLLGILDEGEGLAYQILTDQDVDAAELRSSLTIHP